MQVNSLLKIRSDMAAFVNTVIEQSIALIRTQGIEYVNLKNLSCNTGYSKSHIYKYFGNRSEILDVIIEHLFRQMKTEILKDLDKELAFADLFIILLHRRKDFIIQNKLLELYFKQGIGFTKCLKDLHKNIQTKEDILFADISSMYYGTDKDVTTYIGLDFIQIWNMLLPLDLRNKFLILEDCEQKEQRIRSMFNAKQVSYY